MSDERLCLSKNLLTTLEEKRRGKERKKKKKGSTPQFPEVFFFFPHCSQLPCLFMLTLVPIQRTLADTDFSLASSEGNYLSETANSSRK